MKFCPTTAPFVVISPTCSMIVTMEIGAMARMALRSNLGSTNNWSLMEASVKERKDAEVIEFHHSFASATPNGKEDIANR